MSEQTIVARYDTVGAAQRAIEALRALGLGDEQVRLTRREAPGGGHLGSRPGAAAAAGDHGHRSDGRGEDHGAVLTVRADASRIARIVAVIEHHGAVEIDRDVPEFYATPWTRFDEAAGAFGVAQISDDLLGTEPVEPSNPSETAPPAADTSTPGDRTER